MHVFAKTLSILFHPIFMTCYAYLVIFMLGSYHAHLPASIKQFVMLITFVDTVAMPLILLVIMKYAGIVKDIELNDRKDRIVVSILMIISYGFTLVVFRRLGLPNILLKILFGGIASIFIAMVVSFWWKISYHSIGIGGTTGLFLTMVTTGLVPNNTVLISLVIISGLLLCARLQLGSHTPSQVYVGYLAGFFTLLLAI